MTAVPVLCKVTVGKTSSAAGTTRLTVGHFGSLDDEDEEDDEDEDRLSSFLSSLVVVVAVVVEGDDATAACARAEGGTARPLTENVTLAVIMTPSHVSSAVSSSNNTRTPTTPPSE